MKYLALIGFVSLFAACSSDDSKSSTTPTNTPCNQDPWICPAGQTCWANDQAGNFKCLNSAAGVAKGATCQNLVGSPTCGDGLVCLQLVGGGATGTCVTFCDPAKAGRGCAAGEDCVQVTLQGTSSSFFACVPRATPDAGTDAPVETGTDAAPESGADATSETSADGGADATDGD
jgi:hypothetical protein